MTKKEYRQRNNEKKNTVQSLCIQIASAVQNGKWRHAFELSHQMQKHIMDANTTNYRATINKKDAVINGYKGTLETQTEFAGSTDGKATAVAV